MRIMHDQVRFRDAIAERHDLDVAVGLAADALVAILAEHERLPVLQLHDVFAARIFFRQAEPCAIIKNVAILQNLDERGTLVGRRSLQRVFQLRLKHIHGTRHKGCFRADRQ